MGRCEVCGNSNERMLEVISKGQSHVFDSLECAIHALAPVCDQCGCRILRQELRCGDATYCCGVCAAEAGAVVDREAVAI